MVNRQKSNKKNSEWSCNPLFPPPLHLPFLLDKAGSNRKSNNCQEKDKDGKEYGPARQMDDGKQHEPKTDRHEERGGK